MNYRLDVICQDKEVSIRCDSWLPLIITVKDQTHYYPNATFVITDEEAKAGDDPLIYDSRYDKFKRKGSGFRIERGFRPVELDEEDDI